MLKDTLENALLEYRELIKESGWFVSETPEMIETCLEILGENKIQ